MYYGAASGGQVYRIPAGALADPELPPEELQALIEPYASKPVSDGFRVDGHGRVIVTDLSESGIGVTGPLGYELLIADSERLRWPNGLAFDSNGAVIVTVNELHRHPELNGGEDESSGSYAILRLNEVKAEQ